MELEILINWNSMRILEESGQVKDEDFMIQVISVPTSFSTASFFDSYVPFPTNLLGVPINWGLSFSLPQKREDSIK